MAIIEADRADMTGTADKGDTPMIPASAQTGLPFVRRMEAVSFRSWPAASIHFDGTWAIRLTAGHPSKRLNSVNPLDPADHAQLEDRILRAARTFRAFGRPLVFRQSPLAPPELDNILDARGWLRFDETIVMLADLDMIDLSNAIDMVPLQDSGRWIDQCTAMGSFSTAIKPGMSELIASIRQGNTMPNPIKGQVGLFLTETNSGEGRAAAMGVQLAGMVGVFEVIAHPAHRRSGEGRRIMSSTLLWAQKSGVKTAWLQVVANNEAGVALYESMGFKEAYRYAYRQAPAGFAA